MAVYQVELEDGSSYEVDVEDKPQQKSGLFDSNMMRTALPVAGAVAGDLALRGAGRVSGGILGGMVGGPPGAVIGQQIGGMAAPVLGAMAGQGIRQVGQAFEQGRALPLRKTVGEMAQTAAGAGMAELAPTAAMGAIRTVGRPMLKAAGKVAETVAPFAYIPAQATKRALQRGSQNVLKSEFFSGVPSSLVSHVQTGIKAFSKSASDAFEAGTQSISKGLGLGGRNVDISPALASFRDDLLKSNLVKAQKPTKGFIIPPRMIQEFAEGEPSARKLLIEMERSVRKGQPDILQSQRWIRRIDDLINYGKSGISRLSESSQAALYGLRSSLSELNGKMVPALAKLNSEYAQKIGLLKDVSPRLAEWTAPSTVRKYGARPAEFPSDSMKAINDSLPRKFRFMEELQDYLAGAEFAPTQNALGFHEGFSNLGRMAGRGGIRAAESVARTYKSIKPKLRRAAVGLGTAITAPKRKEE